MKKLRKLLALVLVVCMVCAVSTTAWAEEVADNFVTDEQLANGAPEIERLYQVGLHTTQNKRDLTLYIELIDQQDSRWKNKLLPCSHSGHTYGKIGCAMCSYAMVINYYFSTPNHDYTPVEVATNYSGVACNANGTTLLADYSLIATSGSATSSGFSKAKTAIKGAISEGSPVIVRLKKPSGYHFVVANEYVTYSDGSFDIYILDSESLIAYTTLDQYMDNRGWYPDRYMVVAE